MALGFNYRDQQCSDMGIRNSACSMQKAERIDGVTTLQRDECALVARIRQAMARGLTGDASTYVS
jgi:hypothetical protein